LKYLEEWGITEDDIAVVLIQDGILKLIKDRVTREYTKGSASMI
jgi:vacuolar-type H+-ATPase subunit F/Vma7